MSNSKLVETTIAFVKETLQGAEGGHDWFQIRRVFLNAKLIAQSEEVDILVVELAALLHDIADAKFHDGDETVGPRIASTFLNSIGVPNEIIQHVIKIIENISFKSSIETKTKRFTSKELEVVQDADRLDAIGAIGIARAFNYGGFKNRVLYDPEIRPNLNMTKEEYKKSKSPTINHFYEKLFLLKEKMNTTTGKKLAIQRHQFMCEFVEQFLKEADGKC